VQPTIACYNHKYVLQTEIRVYAYSWSLRLCYDTYEPTILFTPCSLRHNTHGTPSILKDLNWAPLKDRRRDIRLAMLFKIVKCNMPVQADDILLPADPPRTRHHHSFKFKHIQSHTTQYKHSFFVRTVPEWNSLPEACVNADTITAFQTQLHYAPWAVCTPPIVVIRENGLTIIVLELEKKGGPN